MKKVKLETGIRKEWKNIFFDGIFALLCLIVIILFFKHIWLTTLLLLLISIFGLLKWKSWTTFFVFIFGALWGPTTEMIIMVFGAWNYSVHNIWSVPLWAFVLWGDAAVFLYQIGREIRKLGVKE
jgi:hypothetical protein